MGNGECPVGYKEVFYNGHPDCEEIGNNYDNYNRPFINGHNYNNDVPNIPLKTPLSGVVLLEPFKLTVETLGKKINSYEEIVFNFHQLNMEEIKNVLIEAFNEIQINILDFGDFESALNEIRNGSIGVGIALIISYFVRKFNSPSKIDDLLKKINRISGKKVKNKKNNNRNNDRKETNEKIIFGNVYNGFLNAKYLYMPPKSIVNNINIAFENRQIIYERANNIRKKLESFNINKKNLLKDIEFGIGEILMNSYDSIITKRIDGKKYINKEKIDINIKVDIVKGNKIGRPSGTYIKIVIKDWGAGRNAVLSKEKEGNSHYLGQFGYGRNMIKAPKLRDLVIKNNDLIKLFDSGEFNEYLDKNTELRLDYNKGEDGATVTLLKKIKSNKGNKKSKRK